jgi:hypothetical protein
MEDKELHPVVELLLKRMESHPEEFEGNMADPHSDVAYRWSTATNEIFEYGNDADKAAINAGLRNIRLNVAHRWALDELLNGPERRERERQQEITTKKAYAALAQQQPPPAIINYPTNNSYANTLTGAIGASPTLQIGDEKLDAGMLNQIKGMLGI